MDPFVLIFKDGFFERGARRRAHCDFSKGCGLPVGEDLRNCILGRNFGRKHYCALHHEHKGEEGNAKVDYHYDGCKDGCSHLLLPRVKRRNSLQIHSSNRFITPEF